MRFLFMIALSFDIEEFDAPAEQGVSLPLAEQIALSVAGTQAVLDCLHHFGVKATFFCTATFALHAPDVVKRIAAEGHEVASHGYYHSRFEIAHLRQSKEVLENIVNRPVKGYRQARMMPVPEREIALAGYTYNSSLNPTFIPGRYMNFHVPRTCFMKEGVLQIPASVTPLLRFPLFWLSMHNLPMFLYLRLCKRTLAHDGYLATYFHPWEFLELARHPEWKLPSVMTRNSGQCLLNRLHTLIDTFQKTNTPFVTYGKLCEYHTQENHHSATGL